MNINLRDVVCTSKDGDKFWKLTECYIRGSSIKYLRLPEEAVDRVLEEEKQWQGSSGGGGRGMFISFDRLVVPYVMDFVFVFLCSYMDIMHT